MVKSREIQANEYFVTVLAHLLIQNLEKITIPFEDQIKININQREIWHYKVFFHGSCEENTSQSKLKLTNVDRFVGFSNGQIIKMMISFLQRFTEGHDYASHVLYPELIELLLVDIFTIYRKGSPKYFSNSSFF